MYLKNTSRYDILQKTKKSSIYCRKSEDNSMELKITCIPGDGIGPEIVNEAKKVLNKVANKYGHIMNYTDILMGGASIDVYGVPLTDEAIATAKAADAVLMGSIGGDTNTSPWYQLPPNLRSEAGLLKIRKALNLFANLRPAKRASSPLSIIEYPILISGSAKTIAADCPSNSEIIPSFVIIASDEVKPITGISVTLLIPFTNSF